MRATPSVQPVSTRRSSLEKTAARTAAGCSSSTAVSPDAASQTRAAASPPPVTTRPPSPEKAQLRTDSPWPESVIFSAPDAAS